MSGIHRIDVAPLVVPPTASERARTRVQRREEESQGQQHGPHEHEDPSTDDDAASAHEDAGTYDDHGRRELIDHTPPGTPAPAVHVNIVV